MKGCVKTGKCTYSPKEIENLLPSIWQQIYLTVRVSKFASGGKWQVYCIDDSNDELETSLLVPEFHLKHTAINFANKGSYTSGHFIRNL